MTLEFRVGSKLSESSGRTLRMRLAKTTIGIGMAAVSFFCQGCLVVPLRAPTRTNGNSGAMEKINLDFLESGKTTREEVTAKLGGTDTGIKRQAAFSGPLG